MPFHTADPVLLVEESRLRMIDPQDPESLFGMWSAFHKCVGVLENGRRLENLSWRVFAHETMFVSKMRQQQSLNYFANQKRAYPTISNKLPELSSSVDSQSSISTAHDDGDDGLRSPFDTRGSVCPPLERCRTQDKHITPLDLQNLVTAIKEKQTLTGPLAAFTCHYTSPVRNAENVHLQDLTSTTTTVCQNTPSNSVTQHGSSSRNSSVSQHGSSAQDSNPTPRPSSPRPVDSSASTTAYLSSEIISPSSTSETSPESVGSHPIVRGFMTGPKGASSYRSQSQLHLAPHTTSRTSSQASHPSLSEEEEVVSLPRKKGGMFTLGGSMTEDDASVKDKMSPQSQRSAITGHSSLRTSHKPQHQKHASFVEKPTEIPKKKFILSTSAEDGNAIESDDDFDSDEEVSESAIEEDDEEWEDEVDSEEHSKQLTFARVDSRANLVSRRSVITQGLHESQRASELQHAATESRPVLRRSRTSTPNGPSMPASPHESAMQIGSPAASSKPIALPAYNMGSAATQIPLSPRATRRNMLTSELGVSLRKHMLNERQTRNGPYGAAAALQRRHTSHNVAGLTQYPGDNTTTNTSSRNNSYNQYYDLGEYHQTGW